MQKPLDPTHPRNPIKMKNEPELIVIKYIISLSC